MMVIIIIPVATMTIIILIVITIMKCGLPRRKSLIHHRVQL